MAAFDVAGNEEVCIAGDGATQVKFGSLEVIKGRKVLTRKVLKVLNIKNRAKSGSESPLKA